AEPFDHQLSQLHQLLGQQKYGPADAALRRFVPRMERGICPESRAAAIWALGMLHEGKPEPELLALAEGRLNDSPPPPMPPPEDIRVRRMAAITLGRIKAQEALPSLRKYCPDRNPALDPIHNACGWAIEQLTGEAMLPPKPIQKLQREGFLLPLEAGQPA